MSQEFTRDRPIGNFAHYIRAATRRGQPWWSVLLSPLAVRTFPRQSQAYVEIPYRKLPGSSARARLRALSPKVRNVIALATLAVTGGIGFLIYAAFVLHAMDQALHAPTFNTLSWYGAFVLSVLNLVIISGYYGLFQTADTLLLDQVGVTLPAFYLLAPSIYRIRCF